MLSDFLIVLAFTLCESSTERYSCCMNHPTFATAASYLARGVQLVNTPGLRRFVVVPLLINIVVFSLIGWLTYAAFIDWLAGFTLIQWAQDVPVLGVLVEAIRVAMAIALFALLVFFMSLCSNLLAAPFNGLLAEQVAAHLTGRPAPPGSSIMALIKTLPRTLGSEVRKLTYLALMLLMLAVLHWIPVVNFVAPFLLLAFGAWMFAIEYWDYPMGNEGAVFSQVRAHARQHKPAAFGFGSVVALVSSIPLVNFFVMPVAVAAATALWVEQFKDAQPT